MHTLDPPVDLDNPDLKPALDYMLDEASKQEFTYTSVSVPVIASPKLYKSVLEVGSPIQTAFKRYIVMSLQDLVT